MKNKFFVTRLILVITVIFGGVLSSSVFGQFAIKIAPNFKVENGGNSNGIQNKNNFGGQKIMDGEQPIIPGFYDFSATEPKIEKTSFVINATTQTNIVGVGEIKEWAWTPSPQFIIYGPLDDGSTVSVSYTLPNGTTWFEESCGGTLAGIKAGYWYKIECDRTTQLKQTKRTTQTGVFGFKVMLNNELVGKKIELMSGKFKIDKWADNKNYPNDPNFAKHFVYYPKLDWKFPMAMLYTSAPKDAYDLTGTLRVSMWFRGTSNSFYPNNFVGYLFYQGKQVAATNAAGGAVNDEYQEECLGYSDSVVDSRAMVFFFNANLYDNDPYSGSTFFPIQKNPGEYEVKVLQNGKLARSVKFTVDAKGNIVNNGINKSLGTTRILVPAQIIGEQDTKLDKTAWQTEGYWGTPLKGFVAP